MEQLMILFKLLSDETRLRLISLLTKRDYCVCELTEILQLSQPKISKHLTKMRDYKIVETRKVGQYVIYSLVMEDLVLKPYFELIAKTAQLEETLKNDALRVPSCTLDNLIIRRNMLSKGANDS